MLSLTRRCVRLCPSLGPRPSACCTGPHFPTHFMGPRSSAPVMRPRSSAHFGRPRIAQRDWQGTATQQTVFSVEGGRLTRQRSAGSGLALQLLRFPSKVLWQYVAAPLLPAGYPNSVGSGYLEYSLWTGVQYLTGTMTGVLSMQALLSAVGVGAGGTSLPLAATLSWVLRDGVGQGGGILFAATMKNFDAKAKSANWWGVIIMQLATAIELSTPFFPWLFLPLAGLANVGKNISCIAASATRAAINQSFARNTNLADITAKCASQAIVASTIGTGLGCLLLMVTGPQLTHIIPAFAALCGVQMYATHRSLSVVSFRVFDGPRLAHVLQHYWTQGALLSPEAVGLQESVIFHATGAQVNPSVDALGLRPEDLHEQLQDGDGRGYIIPHTSTGEPVLLIREGATDQDVLEGYVVLQRVLFELRGASARAAGLPAAQLRARRYCDAHLPALLEGLRERGWDTGHTLIEEEKRRVLLLPPERVGAGSARPAAAAVDLPPLFVCPAPQH